MRYTKITSFIIAVGINADVFIFLQMKMPLKKTIDHFDKADINNAIY